MKKNLKNSLYLLFFFFVVAVFFSCQQTKKQQSDHYHQEEEYTCPMHPQVVQREPGTCPVCGMDLVKKSGHAAALEITEGIDHLLKPTNTIAVSSIQTVAPFSKTLQTSFNATGIITYDTRQSTTIPVKTGGRIEKLYVKYNFQPIKKGQKILEIYSPDLVTAQRELIFLLNNDNENGALINSAKEKLRLLGASEAQINQLVNTKQVLYSFAVYSPYNGYILEESATGASSVANSVNPVTARDSEGMGGMSGGTDRSNSSSMPFSNNTQLSIREGMYLSVGQTIFKVVNTEKVWAEFDIYQEDAPIIKVNHPVTIQVNQSTEEQIESTVSFVQPFFREGENFTKIRVYLNNPRGRLKVGTLVTATFKSTQTGTWLPLTAVVDLGNNRVVFVKDQEIFKVQKIVTGRKSEEYTEVISGLSEGSEVAVNGQFMIDSESFIRIND